MAKTTKTTTANGTDGYISVGGGRQVPRGSIILSEGELGTKYDESGWRVPIVLHAYLKPLPAEKRKLPRYAVIETLPSFWEYRDMRARHYATTLGKLFEAFQDKLKHVARLAEQDYDSLSDGERGEGTSKAVGFARNIELPSMPEFLKPVKTVWIPETHPKHFESKGLFAWRLYASEAESIVRHFTGEAWDKLNASFDEMKAMFPDNKSLAKLMAASKASGEKFMNVLGEIGDELGSIA